MTDATTSITTTRAAYRRTPAPKTDDHGSPLSPVLIRPVLAPEMEGQTPGRILEAEVEALKASGLLRDSDLRFLKAMQAHRLFRTNPGQHPAETLVLMSKEEHHRFQRLQVRTLRRLEHPTPQVPRPAPAHTSADDASDPIPAPRRGRHVLPFTISNQ